MHHVSGDRQDDGHPGGHRRGRSGQVDDQGARGDPGTTAGEHAGRLLGDAAPALIITLQSFGFKHGTPVNADFLFDVRFLPNPYWDAAIRAYSGSDAPVIAFLEQYDEPRRFVADTAAYLKNWLPAFVQGSNRAYLTVGIGCTGGQHRSVYVTEQIAALLKPDFPGLHVEHRDRKSHTP